MISFPHNSAIAERLYRAVLSHVKTGTCTGLEPLQQLVRADDSIAIQKLHNLITANPDELRVIKHNNPRVYSTEKSWDFRELYSLFASRDGGLGKGCDKYTAVELVEDLEVTVCPYCNRQYINNTTDSKGGRRSSQLDHFFPKSKHPFFALSFYNLIPSCGFCNLTKSSKPLHQSPYEIENDEVDEYLKFGYTPLSSRFLRDFRDIQIEIAEQHQGDDSYTKLFALEGHYQTHKDYVFEILKRKEMYDDAYLSTLKSNLGTLFSDENEMKRIVWGNYTSKEELHKRPLAKLTRDILRDIDPDLLES